MSVRSTHSVDQHSRPVHTGNNRSRIKVDIKTETSRFVPSENCSQATGRCGVSNAMRERPYTCAGQLTSMGENEDEQILQLKGSTECVLISAIQHTRTRTHAHTIELCERHPGVPYTTTTVDPFVNTDVRNNFTQEELVQDDIGGYKIHVNSQRGQTRKSTPKDETHPGRNGIRSSLLLPPVKDSVRDSQAQPIHRACCGEGLKKPRDCVSTNNTVVRSAGRYRAFNIVPRPYSSSSTATKFGRSLKSSENSSVDHRDNSGRGALCGANNDVGIEGCVATPIGLISNRGLKSQQINQTTSQACQNPSIKASVDDSSSRSLKELSSSGEFDVPIYNISASVKETTSQNRYTTSPDSISKVVPQYGISVQLTSHAPSCSFNTSCQTANRVASSARISRQEMGNTQTRHWMEVKNSPRATATQSPEARPDDPGDFTRVVTEKVQHRIPSLVVSDLSIGDREEETQGCEVDEVSSSVDVASQPTEVSEDSYHGPGIALGQKELLRPHKSSDSAYSSDSRCTSIESTDHPIPNAEGEDDEETSMILSSTKQNSVKLLLPPSTKSDGKSLSSSSSSSSSSPCHPATWQDTVNHGTNTSTASPNVTESTLRVISDIGTQRKLSSSSGSSFRSSLSFEESEDDLLSSDGESILRDPVTGMGRRQSKAQSSWKKIRLVIWSPFMQSFKKKYPWVQLAGHAGNFQPGEEGCILKKFCAREAECLHQLSQDEQLRPFAPEYHGRVVKDGEEYTRMQDLLLAFDCPSVMDCKMGIRTYLEDELVKAKIRPRLRHDMYAKMTEISPEEPTKEEHEARAVTKPRYMQWREHVSSSSNLGFRIEGIKKGDNEPSKDYKLTKTKEQVKNAFKYFIDNNVGVLEKYIERLKEVLTATEKSDFFMTHEVIGSSLLFVHDHTGLGSAWMIDFGKTSQLPDNRRLTHRDKWVEGNREDGYLYGLDNLIAIFEEILLEMKTIPRGKTRFDNDGKATEDNAPLPASRPTPVRDTWTLSCQSSNESVESAGDPPGVLPVGGGRKPPLRRQVAATNSCENSVTQKDLTPSVNDVTDKSLKCPDQSAETEVISDDRAGDLRGRET